MNKTIFFSLKTFKIKINYICLSFTRFPNKDDISVFYRTICNFEFMQQKQTSVSQKKRGKGTIVTMTYPLMGGSVVISLTVPLRRNYNYLMLSNYIILY